MEDPVSYEPTSNVVPVIPYASPIILPTSADVWGDGKVIVARNGAVFPPRCVKCNGDVDRPGKRRTYFWHHPGLYALILAGILVYAIVALIIRKKGSVVVCLCPKHRQQRLIGILAGWIGCVGGIATVIAGAANNSPWIAIAGVAIFIAGVVAAFNARLLYPKTIDDHFLWLAGGGSAFVRSLPGLSTPSILPQSLPADSAPL